MRRGMRAFLTLLFVGSLLMVGQQALLPHRTLAASVSSTYYVASLDSTIDPGAQDFLVSAINEAQSAGINHFILVLNTNGGSGDNMENMINAISDYENAGNNFTTLIGPSGRHAFSAGAFIAEASTEIVMVNATSIGSATPIITGIPGEEIASIQQKDINAFSTYMESLAQLNRRNATAAAVMVTAGESYDNANASRWNVVDKWLHVNTISDALAALNVPAGNEIHYPGLRSQFISILSDPNVDALLFLVGAFAILIDFTHPTLILSVVGAAALALALFGFGVFGASLTSIILMLVGAVFIFLELKTHHGISALAGVVIFAFGFLLIFNTSLLPPPPSPSQPPTANFFGPEALSYAIIAAVSIVGISLALYLYGVRATFEKRTPFLDPKGIIGKEGKLITDLKAGGVATANIGAEEWTVTGSVDIPMGTIVRAKEVQGNKLVVERKEG